MALMEQLWLVGPGRTAHQVDPVYLEQARRLLARTDRPANGAESRDAGWSALDRLSGIAAPVLLVVGNQDVPDVLQAAEFMVNRLPTARLAMMEDVAHLPNMERSAAFDAILRDWLAATGAGGGAENPGHGMDRPGARKR